MPRPNRKAVKTYLSAEEQERLTNRSPETVSWMKLCKRLIP